MSPANEIPAIDINAKGIATIRAHVVRDASGVVVSGTVDFIVNYTFPGAATFTGLHIHTGGAGINGPVTINTGIGGAGGNVEDEDGAGNITRSAEVIPSNTTALTALRGLLEDPSGYYVNLHTTVNPGGVIRGQLQRPEILTLMTPMSPRNEVPVITTQDTSSGLAAIIAMRTFGADGNMDSASVMFEVDYQFPEMKTMTGLHIHDGFPGVAAPVVINTGLANMPTTATGVGSLRIPVEVDLSRASNVEVVNRLFVFPDQFYVNLHTTEFPGGVFRGQLRRADQTTYYINMLPGNEVPALTINASAPSNAVVQTVRRADGTVEGGRVIFDVDYRFPDAAEFVGLHIHNQVAGQNGPVIINTGLGSPPLESSTGFGNVYIPVLVSSTIGLTTLDSLLATPENHYMNIHTRVNPGGAVRAQMGEAFTQPPIVGEATSIVLVPGQRDVAPGGLIAIFGRRFAHSQTDLYSWQGSKLPQTLNGTSVTIGGQTAPLVMVNPEQINAQVPFEAGTGMQPVVVTNSAGSSAAFNTNVERYAPGIYPFGDSGGGQVVRFSDVTFITPDNPASVGDILVIFTTGLGQTTPALTTGQVVGNEIFGTAAVTATIGGRAAMTILSAAWPGVPGTYATGIAVPAGVAPGMQPLELTIGGATSNTVMLPVK